MAQNEIWTCWEEILEKIKIFEKSISSQIFTVNMTRFHIETITQVVKISTQFFITMKLKIHMQRIKSFLPPSLVFYPNFFHVKYRQKLQKLIFQKFTWRSLSKKWGKKLVKGVKNFWVTKYESSASFCTKNHLKIFKTCWNRSVSFQCKNWIFLAKKSKIRKKRPPRFKCH